MNDLTITFTIDSEYPITEGPLSEVAAAAFAAGGGKGPVGLSVVITSGETIQIYNRDYAGKDEATDVLSFPAEEEPYAVEPGEPPYLGDILIAYPIAEKQAAEQGHSVMREMQTLVAHGVLHLLGYDHATDEEKNEMYGLQEAVIGSLK